MANKVQSRPVSFNALHLATLWFDNKYKITNTIEHSNVHCMICSRRADISVQGGDVKNRGYPKAER